MGEITSEIARDCSEIAEVRGEAARVRLPVLGLGLGLGSGLGFA